MRHPHTILLLLCITGFANFAQGQTLTKQDRDHALRRIAFSAKAPIAGTTDARTREELIDLLINSINPAIVTLPPNWTLNYPQPINKDWPMGTELRRLVRAQRNAQSRLNRQQMKLWWLQQVASRRSPVAERLMLFWHNFFTLEIKAIPAQLVWRQHMELRQHLLGNYRELLASMVMNPALLLYLDNNKNRKEKPNENFARELLELYALGEGNYTEIDVKELARAMTGATFHSHTGNYEFQNRHHDPGDKTILNQTGKFKPQDVAGLLLSNRQAAVYLTERLWESFISTSPNNEAIIKLANEFREQNYSLRSLLKNIWLHPEFWAKQNRYVLTQSPIEFVINQHWSNGISPKINKSLLSKLKQMGQDPFDPPDVGGWPRGQYWIDASKLIHREHYFRDFASMFSLPLTEPSELDHLK